MAQKQGSRPLQFFIRLASLACFVLVAHSSKAAEPKSVAPAEAQIRKWIQDLESEDFDLRQNAEAALKKAGPTAIPMVRKAMETGEAEVKVRGKRILDELNWQLILDVTDLPRIMPKDTIFLLHTDGLKNSIESLRSQTAIGKFYDSPAFSEMRSLLGAALAEGLQMSEANQRAALTWLDRYGGPNGVGIVGFDTSQQWVREEFVLVVGMNDAHPEESYRDYAVRFPIRAWGDGQILADKYRGVGYTYQGGEWSGEALAKIKNLATRTSNLAAMRKVIDGVTDTQRPSLSNSPDFLEGLQKVHAKPQAALHFNYQQLLHQVGTNLSAQDKAFLSGCDCH